MNPKVSVLMSVYDGDRFLRESIESILSQTFTDFEFIIVNDASTDKTADILKAYSFRDPRIKIITNKTNLGLTKSLNIGIKESTGEYIARMDSDDISLPERIEKQVKFLDENKDHGVVGALVYAIDETGKRIDGFKNWIHEIDNKTIQKKLIKRNVVVHPLAVVRKSTLDLVGGYDESFRYAQDYDLWFRIAMISKIHNLPEFLMNYRMSNSSITTSKNKHQAQCAFRARLNAIKRGQYSIFSSIYLLWPIFRIFLPKKLIDFYK